MNVIRRHPLWVALAVQCLVLIPRLDLLPLWDDERFTLQVAAQPPSGMIRMLEADVHPPFYYVLVRGWLELPLPGNALMRARALSVALALAATASFYLLWLTPLKWNQRAVFLGLWVLSPCVVLYARMARSYMLQALLAGVAIHFAQRWLRSAGGARAMAGYVMAALALLYTHYLPGLAIVAGATALDLWRRRWRGLVPLGLIAAGYLPWIGTLAHTADVVRATKPYWLGTNWALENALKLSYAFVAFSFGETPPVWGLALAALLLPGLAWALWMAWRLSPHPPTLFLLLAGIGYFVAARWVSFAFVGARLLFLLPFYYLFLLRGLDLRRTHGIVTYAGLIVVAAAGLSSYYRQQDFLNKGYLVDFERITRLVRERTDGERTAVLMDRFMTSAGFYLHGPNFPYLAVIDNHQSRAEALEQLHRLHPSVAWYLHYNRDLASHRAVEHELSREYRIERHLFVPYSALDNLAMKWLRLPDRPTHVVEALELRRKGS